MMESIKINERQPSPSSFYQGDPEDSVFDTVAATRYEYEDEVTRPFRSSKRSRLTYEIPPVSSIILLSPRC